LLDDLVFS